jgi:hypothetical protein
MLRLKPFGILKKRDNIRVLASIDDGGTRAFHPVTCDFIKAPDGSFVGE